MTQPEQAVGVAPNDDTVVAAEPTLEDRFAAIDEQPEEPPAEQPAPDGDAPEPEADDIGDDDLPPIAAPVSWTDEEKAEFAGLPRALQETLTRRETEREKFVQTKSREAVTARQAAAAQAADAIKQAQDTHVQQLVAMLPQVPEEPSAHLMVSDATAYAEAVDYRNWVLGQYQHAQQVIQGIEQQQQAMDRQQRENAAKATVDLLQSEFPEYLDDAQRPELQKKLSSIGIALGYSNDQLGNVSGADILALRTASEWKAKADKYDSLMAKRMDKVREAKTLPAVTRPGVAQPRGALANQRYEADRQAMRSGNKEAALRVFSKFV